MIKTANRFIYTISATAIGVCLIWALSYAGDMSRGPLECLLNKMGNVIIKVENKVIINQREVKREDKLEWYKSYKDNVSNLKTPTTFLIGAYDNQTTESFQSVVDLENKLQTTFPLIHIYSAWGDKPEEQFPSLQVESILELGSTPVITWEPWLTDFNDAANPKLRSKEQRDKGGLKDIANGIYDSYIKAWATSAKEINQPIFLRVGHEMNDPYRYPWGPQNNTANDFIAAWKHIHTIFKTEGANKVIWIWSPHPAYGFFSAYYPGDAYVDYVGVGTLNYGTVANWSQWWSFKEIFGQHYKELAQFNKPIMLTEFASLSVGGDRKKWYADALHQLPQNYPAVKSILFFHYSDDNTTTQQTINWYIKNDSLTVNAITKEIKSWSVVATKPK